jgi:hypothetical protein
MAEARLDGESGRYVVLTGLERDHWDETSILLRTQVQVGGFSANVASQIQLQVLAGFREELTTLYELLVGRAELKAVDQDQYEWFALTLIGDGLGHIRVAGHLFDVDWAQISAGNVSRLAFELQTDQTYFQTFMNGLDAILQSFTTASG